MTELLDLGNTRLKRARMDADGRLHELLAWDHAAPDFAETFTAWAQAKHGPSPIALASVAPAACRETVLRILHRAGLPVQRLRTQAQLGEVRIAYAEPERLGVDRFLGLLAAHARAAQPWLIVSVGSALTIDLLAADGQHHGGLIAASPTHMRAALAERFPVLAGSPGRVRDFADDTDDAVSSGLQSSALGLIERSLLRAEGRLQQRPRLLLTGGGSESLRAELPADSDYAPNLVLEGMAVALREAGR